MILTPRDYQDFALNWITKRTIVEGHKGAGLLLDPGLGKTAISLAWIRLIKQLDPSAKFLVIAPLSVIPTTWPEEIQEWTQFNGLRAVIVHGKGKEAVQVYGSIIRESLTKCGLALSSRKTVRTCVPKDSVQSSKDLPAWGMSVDGECWELGTSVRTIKETECGYWPTPTRRDYKGRNGPEGLIRKDGKSRMDQLPNAVAYLGGRTTPQIGHLNPTWVEWLMGWTDLKPLGMDKFQSWLQQHGESSPMA